VERRLKEENIVLENVMEMQKRIDKRRDKFLESNNKENILIDQCLPEHTKILTDRGLKDLDTLQIGDIIFSLDIEKDELVKNKVLKKEIFNYNDNMINFKNDGIDILIASNHKILNKSAIYINKIKYYEWEYTQIKDLRVIHSLVFPLTSIYKGYKSISIDLAKLLGWVLTDGCFHNDKRCNYQDVQISQSSVKINYVNEIRSILENLKIYFREYKIKYINGYTENKYQDRFMYCFCIPKNWNKKIREIIPGKKPTYDLLNLIYEERLALYNAMISGDGNRYYYSNKLYLPEESFIQKDKKTLDWFEMLVLSIGKVPTRGNTKISVKKMNTIGFRKSNFHPKSIHYIGRVWGIISEKSNFIAHQNNKYFIASNSNF